MTGTADINVEKIPQLPGYISNEPQVTIQSDKKVLVESGINEKYSKTQQMAADIASHRQVTRKILHKYSKERTNFEKNEQPLGYGILKNEYEDTNNITKIEPSTVYYEERQRLVDEALQKNGFQVEHRQIAETVDSMVTKLADQVGIVDWIPEGYHNNFKTTMISDLATRYTIIQKELESKQGLSVEKQRMILSIIFDQYGSLKSFILQHLEIRWKQIVSRGVFDLETNIVRLQALFRELLKKKIDTKWLLKNAFSMTDPTQQTSTKMGEKMVKLEFQRFKDMLDAATRTTKLPELQSKNKNEVTKSKVHYGPKQHWKDIVEARFPFQNQIDMAKKEEMTEPGDWLLHDINNLEISYNLEPKTDWQSWLNTERFTDTKTRGMVFPPELKEKISVEKNYERYLNVPAERQQFVLKSEDFNNLVIGINDNQVVKKRKDDENLYESRFCSRVPKGSMSVSTEINYEEANGGKMTIDALEKLDYGISFHRKISNEYNENKHLFDIGELVFLEDTTNTYTLPAATNDIMSMIRQQQQQQGVGHSAFHKDTPLSFREYRDFLQTQHVDYLTELLRDVVDDGVVEPMEETEKDIILRLELEEKQRKEAETKRKVLAYRKGLFTFSRFNLHDEESDETATKNITSSPRDPNDDSDSDTPNINFGGDRPSTAGTALTSASGKASATSDEKLKRNQARLEQIWALLETPLKERIHMAIKYGGAITSKAEAITLWDDASHHILTREDLLKELEDFEMTVADPSRFFRDKAAQYREEAVARDEIMTRLKKVEDRINMVMNTIKHKYHDVVTYRGTPYAEKMMHDYSNILYRTRAAFHNDKSNNIVVTDSEKHN